MALRSPAALAALVLALAPAVLGAQDRQSERAFTLNERVPAGQWLRLRNVVGEVRVRAATGDRVEIVGTKSWRRGDPAMVRIETQKVAGRQHPGVRLLDGERHLRRGRLPLARRGPVEPEQRRRGGLRGSPAEGGERRRVVGERRGQRGGRDGRGVAGSVNGSVDATSSGGPVQASSVNGTVHARMGRVGGTEDLNFSSVNGNVIAEFGEDIDAQIELSTVNGRFQTDWPVTISGRVDPRRLRATIGKGGRRIRMSTVNGNVELRKR